MQKVLNNIEKKKKLPKDSIISNSIKFDPSINAGIITDSEFPGATFERVGLNNNGFKFTYPDETGNNVTIDGKIIGQDIYPSNMDTYKTMKSGLYGQFFNNILRKHYNLYQKGGVMDNTNKSNILQQVIGGLIQDPENTVKKLAEVELSLPGTLELLYTAIGLMAEQGSEEAALAKQVLDLAMGLQAQAAKQGAKLNYIKRLLGQVPEGYTTQYFKIGGKVYSQIIPQVQYAKCGNKVLEAKCNRKVAKGAEGFIADLNKKKSKENLLSKQPKSVNNQQTTTIHTEKCGGKVKKKKCAYGSEINMEKCGGKTKKKC